MNNSKNQHKKENSIGNFEQMYRLQKGNIDIGSAARMDILEGSVVRKALHSTEKRFAKELDSYPSIISDTRLERTLTDKLSRVLDIPLHQEQIIVFRGILSGAFCTLSLWKKEKIILVPENIYQHHKKVFLSYRKRVIEIPISKDGWMKLSALKKAVKKYHQKIAFIYINNLYGGEIKESYLKRVSSILHTNNLYALYDADILYTSYKEGVKPWRPLLNQEFMQHSLFLGNLTKEFGVPGLRVAYGICSGMMAREIKKFQKNSMEMIPTLNRAIAVEIVRNTSLQKVQSELQSRMNLLVNGFHQLGWKVEKPATGINLFLTVPQKFTRSKNFSGGELFSFYLLSRLKIITRPGITYSLKDKDKIRIAVNKKKEKIAEALRRMGKAQVNPRMNMPSRIEQEYLQFTRKKHGT